MKIKLQYFLITLFVSAQLSAQKKDENIGTEVVNVVKPYTPTISDAFKVKETPAQEDEDNTKREPIKYSIYSFPVASTFAPSKGRAANVDKTAQERIYKNYVTGGIGSYLDLMGELYVTENIGDYDYVAGNLKHLSAFTNVKGLEVDSKFLNTSLDLTYGSRRKSLAWNADMGYQVQKYYWYGLPDDFGAGFSNAVREDIIEDINKVQTYHNFYVGGKLKFNESAFSDMDLKYNAFWDAFGSQESRFFAKPKFAFDFLEKRITTEIIADYVGGSFYKNYNGIRNQSYGVTKLGVYPSFGMKKDDWSFNIGVGLFYGADNENDENKVFFYPRATANLKVVGDLMQFYLGIDGDLQQNSYRDFSNQNPFVSPTLIITTTDQQYDFYAGLKGKLSNEISYNLRGSLINEKNKPLFVANNYSEAPGQDRYKYGNSFGVIYDLVRTTRLFGELKADFSKNVTVGINGTFSKYTTENEREAWNLPQIEFGANLDVTITEKWYAGANVFFVGERKDRQTNLDILPIVVSNDIQTVKSYFDANAHLGYKYTDRFTAFLRLNNLANQNYERWLNFPVQSFQVMLGANYKFDF
ncbi:TonB-dependent receptor [Flavobacterium sp. CYK-4]|uniref:TonB-dependent receptor n=1 Tax=Flavobacterium lotistagni TaxID=2709660 RepID=UPI00140B1C8E|nr:TonB-dependent receptor [Flavobacterium lotistagni]NHM07013.1 TonB-dependent receptor [Flavobacterium lotistagni]